MLPSSVNAIIKAHKASSFHNHRNVSFDLLLHLGDREVFSGRIHSTTNSNAIRLDYNNGKKLLYSDGELYTYAEPNPNKKKGDQFAVFTWQYFFLAPFKFDDPGTHWKDIEPITLDGKKYDSHLLTFDDGVGDSPDDWYIVHPDPQTHLVHNMGYIVTAGGISQSEAEKKSHAISYLDYKDVEGIPFAQKWIFNDYIKGVGLGKKYGEGSITNIKFDESDGLFDPKSNVLFLKYD